MRTLYILTLLMISSISKSQNLTCSDFKIGTFKMICTNYKLPAWTINRTEKIQKESTEGSDKELEGSIEWKSECIYELIYLNASPEMNGKKVTTEINKIEGRKGFCKSTFEGLPGIILELEIEKLN